jgi:hypothetical protein
MKRSARPEQIIQRAVFAHLRTRTAPGLFAFAVPNGGYRKPIEAAIMKGLGVKAGVPDLIAVHRGQVFALEIKTENGRATDAQVQAIADIRGAGGHAEICHGLDAAIKQLEDWQLLRGRVQ